MTKRPETSGATTKWQIRLLAILAPGQRDDNVPLPLINAIVLTDGKWLPNPHHIANATGVHYDPKHEFNVTILGQKTRLIQFTGRPEDMEKAPSVQESTRNWALSDNPLDEQWATAYIDIPKVKPPLSIRSQKTITETITGEETLAHKIPLNMVSLHVHSNQVPPYPDIATVARETGLKMSRRTDTFKMAEGTDGKTIAYCYHGIGKDKARGITLHDKEAKDGYSSPLGERGKTTEGSLIRKMRMQALRQDHALFDTIEDVFRTAGPNADSLISKATEKLPGTSRALLHNVALVIASTYTFQSRDIEHRLIIFTIPLHAFTSKLPAEGPQHYGIPQTAKWLASPEGLPQALGLPPTTTIAVCINASSGTSHDWESLGKINGFTKAIGRQLEAGKKAIDIPAFATPQESSPFAAEAEPGPTTPILKTIQVGSLAIVGYAIADSIEAAGKIIIKQSETIANDNYIATLRDRLQEDLRTSTHIKDLQIGIPTAGLPSCTDTVIRCRPGNHPGLTADSMQYQGQIAELTGEIFEAMPEKSTYPILYVGIYEYKDKRQIKLAAYTPNSPKPFYEQTEPAQDYGWDNVLPYITYGVSQKLREIGCTVVLNDIVYKHDKNSSEDDDNLPGPH